MDDISRRISVQTEGTDNVLAIELEDGENLIPYCCKVMESNNIPGLLRMTHRTMDGVVTLRFNIGGKVPLREFMVQHRLNYQNGILLLRNLTSALLNLNTYFLSTDMCYLDPEQVYIGDGLATFLPCIPVENGKVRNSATYLKQFYEKLLSEYFATADCNSYDDMFKWVYKASLFDLQTFYNEFLKESSSDNKTDKREPTKPQPQSAPRKKTGVAQETQPDSKSGSDKLLKGIQALYPETKDNSGETGKGNTRGNQEQPELQKDAKVVMNIPGGKSFEIPGKGSKQKEPAEKKKGGWFFPADKSQEQESSGQDKEKQKRSPRGFAKKSRNEKEEQPQGEGWDSGTILVDQTDSEPELPKQEPAVTQASFVHNGQTVEISETPFIVGKYNSSCKLNYAIYDNNKVSRSHATFLLDHGQYFIRDNQSRNGTTLNGRPLIPLKPELLHDGDEIRLYDEVLIFHQG